MPDKERLNDKSETGAGIFAPFDFAKLMAPYSFAGVEVSKLLEREQRNIASLTDVNRTIFDTWQTLMCRQAEVFQETMADTIAAASSQKGAKSSFDLATLGFEKGLANMREIAELATKCQQEAFGIVQKRVGEHLADLQRGRDSVSR